MMTGFGIGFGGIGIVFMVLLWGGLIFGVVGLVKAISSSGQQDQSGLGTSQQPSAREFLDQRYARGEIDREQYEIMRQDLM